MLARPVLFVALVGFALTAATGAEAKRFRLSFGGSKAHAATPKPSALPAAGPAVGAAPAATTNRSGGFVFVSTGRNSSSTAPADEQRRPRSSEPAPMLATMTDAPGYAPRPAAGKPARPAYGFETVQAQVPGFEVMKPRH